MTKAGLWAATFCLASSRASAAAWRGAVSPSKRRSQSVRRRVGRPEAGGCELIRIQFGTLAWNLIDCQRAKCGRSRHDCLSRAPQVSLARKPFACAAAVVGRKAPAGGRVASQPNNIEEKRARELRTGGPSWPVGGLITLHWPHHLAARWRGRGSAILLDESCRRRGLAAAAQLEPETRPPPPWTQSPVRSGPARWKPIVRFGKSRAASGMVRLFTLEAWRARESRAGLIPR